MRSTDYDNHRCWRYFSVFCGGRRPGIRVQKKGIQESRLLLFGGKAHPLALAFHFGIGVQFRYNRDHVDRIHPVRSRDEIHLASLDVGIPDGSLFPGIYREMGPPVQRDDSCRMDENPVWR